MSRSFHSDCALWMIGLFLLFIWILVVASPANSAECPEGTRNNYKGECIGIVGPDSNSDENPTNTSEYEENPISTDDSEWVDPTGQIDDIADDDDDEETASSEWEGIGTGATSDSKIISMDLARALVTIQELRDEIKDLLNRVELQRYELDKLRGRQLDLYNDLDLRLTKQERLVLEVPLPDTLASGEATGSPELKKVELPEPTLMSIEDAEDGDITPVSEEQFSEESIELPDSESATLEISLDSEGVLEPTIMSVQDSEDATASPDSADYPELQPIELSNSNSAILPIPEVQNEDPAIDLEVDSESLSADKELSEQVIMSEYGDSQSMSESIAKVGDEVDSDIVEKQVLPSAETNLTTEEAASDPDNRVSVAVQLSDSPDDLSPVAVSTAVTLAEQNAYDQAFNLLKQSRYEEAAEQFANFLRQYRNSQLTDDAWYWMAEAHYVTRDFDRAIIAFNTVVDYFTASPRIPASRLKIGYIQYEKQEYDAARQSLSELLEDFPAHRVAVSAEARLKKMSREGY